MSHPPFIVYGLPRSRTYWLSRFLTYGEWSCGHEEIRHARSLEDVKAWFGQPCTGTAETAGAPWWRLVQAVRPDIKTVVVRRPVDDVVRSMIGTGVPFDEQKVTLAARKLNAKLDQIERRVPGVLSVKVEDLESEDTCRQVFEHCLPYQHDPDWYALTAPMNLQINLHTLVRYYQAHREQLEKLAAMAKQRTISEFASRPVTMEGLTFQEEPLTAAFRDGAILIADHCVLVGEAPLERFDKNWPLMLDLECIGRLSVMTARSNGRMFGYIVTIIGPSLESTNTICATQTSFFASKDLPGLGSKLQRACLNALRARGVSEVTFRTGTRGSGSRIGSIFRRIGAEASGELFMLKLGDH